MTQEIQESVTYEEPTYPGVRSICYIQLYIPNIYSSTSLSQRAMK